MNITNFSNDAFNAMFELQKTENNNLENFEDVDNLKDINTFSTTVNKTEEDRFRNATGESETELPYSLRNWPEDITHLIKSDTLNSVNLRKEFYVFVKNQQTNAFFDVKSNFRSYIAEFNEKCFDMFHPRESHPIITDFEERVLLTPQLSANLTLKQINDDLEYKRQMEDIEQKEHEEMRLLSTLIDKYKIKMEKLTASLNELEQKILDICDKYHKTIAMFTKFEQELEQTENKQQDGLIESMKKYGNDFLKTYDIKSMCIKYKQLMHNYNNFFASAAPIGQPAKSCIASGNAGEAGFKKLYM
jgi:hypothetical protein